MRIVLTHLPVSVSGRTYVRDGVMAIRLAKAMAPYRTPLTRFEARFFLFALLSFMLSASAYACFK